MIRILPSFLLRAALCGGVILLVGACWNAPAKYHRMASGEFNEWQTYEGKHFEPSNGSVTAVNVAANTVTISKGKDSMVFPVTPKTRIMHEGSDITLAQLPVGQTIKYTVSDDGKELRTVWYGHEILANRVANHRPSSKKASEENPQAMPTP